MGFPFLAVGAALSAIGTAGSIAQGRQANKAQEKAIEDQQRMEAIALKRKRLATIREQRIKAASIEAGAANTGGSNSSGRLGGVGSLTSQTSSQLGYLSGQQFLGQQANQHLQQASQARGNAATFGAVGKFGQQLFTDYGGFKELNKTLGIG